MQKYLYRNVIITILLLALSLLANENKQTGFNLEPKIDALKNTDFLKDLDKASKDSFKKYGLNIFNNKSASLSSALSSDENNTTKNTLFYFYSETMPINAIKNLIPQIKTFKKMSPKTQFMIVFNGIPDKSFFKELRKLYKDKYKDVFKVKIHPFIYDYYELKKVPAFVFLKCGLGSNFRFKKCLNKEAYLVKGDISLIDFFEILSEKEDKYKKVFNYMTEVHYE